MSARRQTGVSLVELMVGMALGLFLTSLGLMNLGVQLRESRVLLMEARLAQDLRASADLIARSLRRAGAWHEAASSTWAGRANPHAAWSAQDETVRFTYGAPGATGEPQSIAYRLRKGVVEMRLGDGAWQALTDPAALRVQRFALDPRVERVSLAALCASTCAADSPAPCEPVVELRSLSLQIEAQSPADGRIRRQLELTVRLRNDPVLGQCAVA